MLIEACALHVIWAMHVLLCYGHRCQCKSNSWYFPPENVLVSLVAFSQDTSPKYLLKPFCCWPKYSVRIRSVPWLLMLRPLTLPDHQPLWYWLQYEAWSRWRSYSICLHHLRVEKWKTLQTCFYFDKFILKHHKGQHIDGLVQERHYSIADALSMG